MMAPSAQELLRVWEEHQRSPLVRRALGALAAAAPERGWEGWAQAPIGERDTALLGLHEQLFGGDLHTVAACPRCGERLQLDFSASQIRSGAAAAPPQTFQCCDDEFTIDYRLPTSADLLRVAAAPARDAAQGMVALLRQCVIRLRRGEAAVDPAALPSEVVEHLAAAMAQHDPAADVRIALECPACAYAWELPFDIVPYFWGELDDWAQRTLADVHTLACAYGWTESTTLSLSARRRQMYLDMVGAA
jgi:hypothetical protein